MIIAERTLRAERNTGVPVLVLRPGDGGTVICRRRRGAPYGHLRLKDVAHSGTITVEGRQPRDLRSKGIELRRVPVFPACCKLGDDIQRLRSPGAGRVRGESGMAKEAVGLPEREGVDK